MYAQRSGNWCSEVQAFSLLLLQSLEHLEGRVKQLEDQQAKHSGNSSVPPSKNPLASPLKRSLRKKGGLSPGGRAGHPGTGGRLTEDPDEVVRYQLDRCPECAESLSEVLPAQVKKKQVRLRIDRAAEVQLIADGATWIWNKLPVLLEQLGVSRQRTTQTLDYYHAVQHLETLFKTLPARISKRQRGQWWKRCKEWLWQGRSRGIVRLFSSLYERFPAAMRTELNYFTNHRERMCYADYEASNLLCGSGLVESAIRRVINLRYKNTSTFWDKATVEKLYFLRGAVLSKRWDVVINNLQNRVPGVGQE